jgi:Fe-S cluster assembly protein SufD
LGKDANCQYYRLHLEEQHSIHLGGIYAELAQNAQLGTFQLSLGGRLKRTDTNIFHRGEGSNSNLKGIYLPKLNQCIDMHTNVEHIVPRCTSEQTFRGVVGDNARAIFNGRIHIHPKAQKTSAHLSNKNLLTSEKAEIYTKPELEIYADDVKCSHGATVAQMNDEALHYFCARGISHATAKIMLSQGFVNELLEGITIPALVEYLRPIIATWFEANQFAGLTQLSERELLV